MENLIPPTEQISPEEQLVIMRRTGEAALATSRQWKRPIAASSVDNQTHNVIMTATNYDPAHFNHAEERLLSQLDEYEDVSFFVTKEPCTYRQVDGHIPCAEQIIRSEKVSSVYILDNDPNARINGRGVQKLERHGISVNVVNDVELRRQQQNEWTLREEPTPKEAWGDVYHSPKGEQKAIIRHEVLPRMLNTHERRGGAIDHFIDVGAADGELTQALMSAYGRPIQQVTAIEPNASKEGPLRAIADNIMTDNFDTWHENNHDVKADFILASHVAYYFDNPVEGVRKMASHLNANGTLGVVLADWRSGRTQLLRQADVLDLSEDIYDSGFPRQINAHHLAGSLQNEFHVSNPVHVSVPVIFQSEGEAFDRLGATLRAEDVRPEVAREVIRKSFHIQDDGRVIWGRDCIYFTLHR